MQIICSTCSAAFTAWPSKKRKYCSHKCSLAAMHKKNTKHGHGGRINRSPTYRVWSGMIQRCSSPNNSAFRHYGGRGITICDQWRTFENFLADMGERPEGLELERKDNNGNYEPLNCKWATRQEQCSNFSRNHLLTFNGKTQHVFGWAREIGVKPSTLNSRLIAGWGIDRALTEVTSSGHRHQKHRQLATSGMSYE